MSETILLVLCMVAGALLGAIFFGGLWWTVQRGVASSNPALVFLVSMLLRTGIVVAGFYLISQGRWQRLLACLLGFILVRAIVTRISCTPASKPALLNDEASHAP